MDKTETAKLLMLIRSSYPKQADVLTNPEVAEVWYNALKDIDYEVAKLAVTKWLMTEKWMPTIADIRESCASIQSEDVMDWSEAWSIVNRAVRLIGPYREEEAMSRFDDVTRETVQRIRYMTLCEMESSERDIMRAHFRDIYNQIAARHKEQAQLPTRLKEMISQIGVPKNDRLEQGERDEI